MPKPTQPTNPAAAWRLRDRFVEIHSRWLTVIGEHLEDSQGQSVEYWRVEKAHSVIVLPIQQQHLLLPRPSYRPGIGQATWDFPGGRIPGSDNFGDRLDNAFGNALQAAAQNVLDRELQIPTTMILSLKRLNPQGWAINSSFSNQKLYGFIAEIAPDLLLPKAVARYPITDAGLRSLLTDLTCLQCRAVLQEWLISQQNPELGPHHLS